MKQLIIIAVVFTVLSCGNKKAEIVEQIKAYKDSLTVVEVSERELSIERTNLLRLYADSMKTVNYDKVNLKELGKINNYNLELEKRKQDAEFALLNAQMTKKIDLTVKRNRFEVKIDSLELELKKY